MGILVLLIGGGFFGYALVYKPDWVATLLFTLIIANINFDINSLPLNLKAIITLALFGRVIIDKENTSSYPAFLGVGSVKLFLVYMLYVLLISFGQDLFTFDLLKQSMSTFLSAFCAYHFFFVKRNNNVLRNAMVWAGIICFVDLAYTYTVFGSFPVQRLYLGLTGQAPDEIDPDGFFVSAVNHNFFGQICGMAFLFIFSDLIKNKTSSKLLMILLPIMFMGVLMSTSRSALMGMIIVSIIIIYNGVKLKEERTKVYKIGSFAMVAIVIGILLFTTLGMYFKLDSKFVDEVVFRLTEEPIAILQRALGQNYNVQNLGSMDWREEASADAYAAYMHLDFREQLTGIGQGGFLERNLGHGLNPHNGVLLILIETGILGLGMYIFLIGGLLWQAVRSKMISPSFGIIIFTLIYGIGQNGEMTSITTFLFVSTLIAEVQYSKIAEEEEEEDIDYSFDTMQA